MEQNEIRYCEDCRFYQEAQNGDPAMARCGKATALAGIRLVTRVANRTRYCEIERTMPGPDNCCHEARWFEPKGAAK